MRQLYRKIYAFALAFAMLFAQARPVFAQEGGPRPVGDYETVVVSQAVPAEPSEREGQPSGTESRPAGDAAQSGDDGQSGGAAAEGGGAQDGPGPSAAPNPSGSRWAMDGYNICGCPIDAGGLVLHQPGCPEYVMSRDLAKLCELARGLPPPEKAYWYDASLSRLMEEITERYYGLSAFDAVIFDHSEYMLRLLEVDEARARPGDGAALPGGPRDSGPGANAADSGAAPAGPEGRLDSGYVDVSHAFHIEMEGWSYCGVEKRPSAYYDGDADVTGMTEFSYREAAGGTYLSREDLWRTNGSSSGLLNAGEYVVKAVYRNERYGHIAQKEESFTVKPRSVYISKGTLAAEDRMFGADSGVELSGEAVIEGAAANDDVSVRLGQAYFASPDAGGEIAILTPGLSLYGPDSGNYLLIDNEIRELTGRISRADGVLNPQYLSALDTLAGVHIITNISPTLGDVELPEGWSFLDPPDQRISVSDSGQTGYRLKYESGDPNYNDVTLPSYRIKTSAVSLEDAGTILGRTGQKGQTLDIYSVRISVEGSPLPAYGRGSLGDMIWRCDYNNIVTVEGYDIRDSVAAVNLKCVGGGAAMVELAYTGSADPIGSIMVRVQGDSVTRNSVEELVNMSGALERGAGSAGLPDREDVRALAWAFRELPNGDKGSVTADDIMPVENLLSAAGAASLTTGYTVEPPQKAGAVSPEEVRVWGMALGGGVDEGEVSVRITPLEAGGSHEMVLEAQFLVNSAPEQPSFPIFFAMKLPQNVYMPALEIRHVKDDGGSERVPFEYSGNTVYFKLDSFSRLEFTRSATGSGSGAERTPASAVTEEDIWRQAEGLINSASSGGTVMVEAEGRDRVPAGIITLLKENGVKLIIERGTGAPLVLDGRTLDITPESNRVFYPFEMLEQLLYGGNSAAGEGGEPEGQAASRQSPTIVRPSRSQQPEPAQAASGQLTVGGHTISAMHIAAGCVVLLLAMALVLLIALAKGKEDKDKEQ